MRGRVFRALILLFLLMFVAKVDFSMGQAGVSFAQLNGTVMDQSGGTVGQANIPLREVDTTSTYTATSTDNGFYVIPNVTPGNYELKVDFTGFAPYRQT